MDDQHYLPELVRTLSYSPVKHLRKILEESAFNVVPKALMDWNSELDDLKRTFYYTPCPP